MSYQLKPVTLDLESNVNHECYIHYTRDQHLIGIIKFQKSGYILNWQDLEYIRRRTEEFSVMPIPDCINGIIVDIREIDAFLDTDVPIVPWRLIEEECPIRIVVPADRVDHYAGFFEPTWLSSDLDTAILEIREFMDMLVH